MQSENTAKNKNSLKQQKYNRLSLRLPKLQKLEKFENIGKIISEKFGILIEEVSQSSSSYTSRNQTPLTTNYDFT